MVVKPRPATDNPLWEYFSSNPGRRIHKWDHYFDVYHNHFRRFRNQPVTILEIGVWDGGSLQMWKNYFGQNARIFGVDIDPRCQQYEEEQIRVFIGDQSDRQFLRQLADQIGPIDILIDDGGHRMQQQIATFQELYPAVSSTGVYLVEDLHTSYWKRYGGGYKAPESFIEFAKCLVDQVNAWHANDSGLAVSDFSRSATGLHFYPSLLVIEKFPMLSSPVDSSSGRPAS